MIRALRFLQVGALCILIAGSLALYAQDDKQQPEPPRQDEPHPEKNQDKMNQPRQEEAKPLKQDKQGQKADKQQEKDQEKQSHEQMKAGREMNDAQQGHAHPAGKSARIPDNKFRTSFGRSHTFVVRRPVIVQGQPGFVYGGYSFVLVNPWPADWAYTDNCYVDYIDGEYFLFDLMHPGVRLALFVVL
ncbi:MAG: hypothetical protein WAM79_03775 [Candidatus Sulfotelmatobacter sp.]